MKIKYILLSAIALLLVNSCEDALQEEPVDFLSSSNFWQTKQDAISGINAVYDLFKGGGYYHRELPCHLIHASDYADGRGSYTPNGNYELDQRNTERKTQIWTALYRTILFANKAIEQIPGMAVLEDDVALKNRLVGEALTIRALSNFHLVRLWGAVPLRTSSVGTLDEIASGKSSEDEIYQAIISDLLEAESLLPDENEMARINKAAAQAVLAKVYLTRGNYQDAKTYAQKIISSGNYTLVPTLDELYDPEVPATDELILWIRYSRELGISSNMLQMMHHKDAPQYTPVAWYAILGDAGSFLSTWDVNDKRKDWNLYDKNTPCLPAGSVTDTIYINSESIHFRKYRDPNASPDHSLNMPVFRYAEVLMIYAEAENELNGPTTDAYDKLNMVRRRGYGVDMNTENTEVDIPSGLTKDELREWIFDERGKEFLMEGKRWYDMVRFGKAAELINAVGEPWDDKYLKWPIPVEEIYNNEGLTSDDQNPGW